ARPVRSIRRLPRGSDRRRGGGVLSAGHGDRPDGAHLRGAGSVQALLVGTPRAAVSVGSGVPAVLALSRPVHLPARALRRGRDRPPVCACAALSGAMAMGDLGGGDDRLRRDRRVALGSDRLLGMTGTAVLWPWHFALRDIVRYVRRSRARTMRC